MSGIKHEDECGVCFSSLGDSGKDSTEGVVILPCRHSFCRACLLQYLVQNIRTGARRISCMVGHSVESLFRASTWFRCFAWSSEPTGFLSIQQSSETERKPVGSNDDFASNCKNIKPQTTDFILARFIRIKRQNVQVPLLQFYKDIHFACLIRNLQYFVQDHLPVHPIHSCALADSWKIQSYIFL